MRTNLDSESDGCGSVCAMSIGVTEMSAYEAKAWADLQKYWEKKSERRELPPKAKKALEKTSGKVKDAASATGDFVSGVTPQTVKDAGGIVLDWTLEPTVKAVVGLLELVTDWVQEANSVESVFEYHRSNGHEIESLDDLRRIDMKDLDRYTRTLALRWRTIGAVEGGAMGALTFIPIAGSVAAIPADLVVMHALSTAIATKAAYAYGIDPTSEDERHHLDRMLRKAWLAQAPKSGTVNSAHHAFREGAGRVRWSQKFRQDHRIAAALENLMKQVGNGKHVPIDKVVSKLPGLAVVTAAGINSTVLGSLAKTSLRYSQTVYLSEKYGLPMPGNLIQASDEGP
jgi:hypothetical protein